MELFRMSDLVDIDWAHDVELLRKPSELDARVEELLATTVTAELPDMSPSSFFSTPSTLVSSSPGASEETKSSSSSHPAEFPCKQVSQPDKPFSVVPNNPLVKSKNVPDSGLRQVAKIKWESPAEKIKKYENRLLYRNLFVLQEIITLVLSW